MKGMATVLMVAIFLFSLGAGMGAPIVAGIGGAAFVLAALFTRKADFMNGITTMGISREVWEAHIEENLFPSNEFVLDMMDESEYVNFRTVHSPNAGAAPNVVKNRVLTGSGQTEVTHSTRVDTVVDWSIDEYTTDPFKIVNAEEVELSYNKRESILYEQEMALRKAIGDNILVAIAPTGGATLPEGGTNNNILRSTGITNNDVNNVLSTAAYTSGTATGNRLKFTLYDVKQAALLFDTQNIPAEDRTMVMSAQAKNQLIDDLIATKYRGSLGDVFDTKTGQVDMLMGFKIRVRSKVCLFDNQATPVVKAVGASATTDENDAIIFFQKAFVARAIGDIHVFATENSAVYYGNIYSALVRMGATKKRSSELGVGAIVQAASA